MKAFSRIWGFFMQTGFRIYHIHFWCGWLDMQTMRNGFLLTGGGARGWFKKKINCIWQSIIASQSIWFGLRAVQVIKLIYYACDMRYVLSTISHLKWNNETCDGAERICEVAKLRCCEMNSPFYGWCCLMVVGDVV